VHRATDYPHVLPQMFVGPPFRLETSWVISMPARDFPQRQPRLKLLGPGSKILDSPTSEPPTGRFGNSFVIRASEAASRRTSSSGLSVCSFARSGVDEGLGKLLKVFK
jgi:hypothetical protein